MFMKKIIVLIIFTVTSCTTTETHVKENRCGFKNGDKVLISGKIEGVVTDRSSAWESEHEVAVQYLSDHGEVKLHRIDCSLLTRK